MHPRDLRVENFAAYPPQGRSLVTANLNWLRCTPLLLMSLMLRPIIQYDGSLSAEREQRLLSQPLTLFARFATCQSKLLARDPRMQPRDKGDL